MNIQKCNFEYISSRLGFSNQSVVKWFLGKTMPQPQIVLLIAEMTNDTPQDVFEFFKGRYIKNYGKAEGIKKYNRYVAVNKKYVDNIAF